MDSSDKDLKPIPTGTYDLGKFTLHIANCGFDPPHKINYYLILLLELRNSIPLYVSLSKDVRFVKFKPDKKRDAVEHAHFLESTNQQQPLWKLHNRSLLELIEYCKSL